MELIPRHVGKDEAVGLLASRLGIWAPDKDKPDLKIVMEAFGQTPALSNAGFLFCNSTDALRLGLGLAIQSHFPAKDRQATPPAHRNGVPIGFKGVAGGERSPELKVLAIPGGALALVEHAPVVLPSTRDRIITDFSSGYARLLQAYDWSFARVLDGARSIRGDALVLCDNVWPLNYSHWLLDELPRLACLGSRRDLSLVVAEPVAPFQYETLERLGFSRHQVVRIADFSAVQADRLLVTCDVHDMPHPAFKGAEWALRLLRSKLPFVDPPLPSKRKFYVSRQDAKGRFVRNERALMELLRLRGYDCLTLGERSVAEQAWLFGAATHIVSLHGAGLANLAFAQPGSQIIELFPKGYGTPAFYVMAGAAGCHYATYLADGVVEDQKDRDQIYDACLDLDHFAHACRDIL